VSKQQPPRGEPFSFATWDSGGSEEEFAETQRILATIPGGPELLTWFGGEASFHDAEVVRVDLDRENGSRLELTVSGRAGINARVTFVLTDWIDVAVMGFSRQNVIGQLLLREPDDRTAEPWEIGVGMASGDHEIRLTPIFGAYGTIRATIKKIELTELQERKPKGRR
jgi:hypothetical protein